MYAADADHFHRANSDCSASPTMVHIVDDNQVSADAIAALVATIGYRSKCFESAEAYLSMQQARPACLVLDLVLGGMSGLDLQKRLSETQQAIPVVIISAFADVNTAVACMENGAVTLLEKPCEDDALLNAIQHAVQHGEEQAKLLKKLEKLQSIERILVPRERDVLGKVIKGSLNKQIARDLKVSERTIENVRSRLMKKFAADNATELAAKYTELNLLQSFAHRLSPRRRQQSLPQGFSASEA